MCSILLGKEDSISKLKVSDQMFSLTSDSVKMGQSPKGRFVLILVKSGGLIPFCRFRIFGISTASRSAFSAENFSKSSAASLMPLD